MIKNNLALLKGSQFMFITRREKYNCFIHCLQCMKILPHWSIQLLSKNFYTDNFASLCPFYQGRVCWCCYPEISLMLNKTSRVNSYYGSFYSTTFKQEIMVITQTSYIYIYIPNSHKLLQYKRYAWIYTCIYKICVCVYIHTHMWQVRLQCMRGCF